jgi:hypothetical protein
VNIKKFKIFKYQSNNWKVRTHGHTCTQFNWAWPQSSVTNDWCGVWVIRLTHKGCFYSFTTQASIFVLQWLLNYCPPTNMFNFWWSGIDLGPSLYEGLGPIWNQNRIILFVKNFKLGPTCDFTWPKFEFKIVRMTCHLTWHTLWCQNFWPKTIKGMLLGWILDFLPWAQGY